MNYTKKDLGSYGLHLIHTDKLKTITNFKQTNDYRLIYCNYC